ncbi:variable surface lipoprotein [Mycoplasma sp. VS292A]|uniref:variable surface lipoprotein n=1 Tax=Mycoplasma sp. VS292A TaxID=3401680 RepID=UPI003AAA5DB4
MKLRKLALLSLTLAPIMAMPIVAASCSTKQTQEEKEKKEAQSQLVQKAQEWKNLLEVKNQKITEKYLPIIDKFQPTADFDNQSVLIQKSNHYVLLKQLNEQLIKELSKENITQEKYDALDKKAKDFDQQEVENGNNVYTMKKLYEHKFIEIKPEFQDQKDELVKFISAYIFF